MKNAKWHYSILSVLKILVTNFTEMQYAIYHSQYLIKINIK